MASNEVDWYQVVPVVLFPIFAGFVFGVWSLELTVFGGFDFTQVWWSSSSFELTPALLGATGSSVGIVLSNELDGSDYDKYEYAVIIVMLALPLLYAAIPLLSDLMQPDLARVLVWLLEAVGVTYISYAE
jgi:hypothetical protein